jgi:hypothetical protein
MEVYSRGSSAPTFSYLPLQDFPRGLLDGIRELVSDFIKVRKKFIITN